MVSTVVWRTYAHSGLEEMAATPDVPVINSLSDDYHPCQLLADLLTVQEHKGKLAGLTMAYLGDAANNMANSYLLAGVTAGMHVRIGGPEGYLPAAVRGGRSRSQRRRNRRVRAGHHGSGTGAGRGRRGCHRHLGLDGPGRREGAAAGAVQGLRGGPSRPGPGPPAMPSCCTACRPTAARRSPPR